VVLLVIFARSAPAFGILLSWVFPAWLLVPVVNLLIFGRIVPERRRAPSEARPPVAASSILRFGAGNFVGALFFVVYSTFLPVLVTNQVGVSATAYFYLPWTVATAIQLIGQSMASSLVVEAAVDASQLKAYVRRILASSFGILAPIVLLLLLGAQLFLQIYGPAYAAEGALLMRLLAIAAFPGTLVGVAIGVMRARNRNWQIVLSQALLCGLAMGLAYALLPQYGINGVGIAWLIAQSVVALILLATEFWPLWRPVAGVTHPQSSSPRPEEQP
jgi:O-antigen/teichoic acid export membrane protein